MRHMLRADHTETHSLNYKIYLAKVWTMAIAKSLGIFLLLTLLQLSEPFVRISEQSIFNLTFSAAIFFALIAFNTTLIEMYKEKRTRSPRKIASYHK